MLHSVSVPPEEALKDYMQFIRKHHMSVQFSKAQVKLLVRRLDTIYETFVKLPATTCGLYLRKNSGSHLYSSSTQYSLKTTRNVKNQPITDFDRGMNEQFHNDPGVGDSLGPSPTPQLLSIFQCAAFIISKLLPSSVGEPVSGCGILVSSTTSSGCDRDRTYQDETWKVVLASRFICSNYFFTLKDRIRRVWKLHNTDHWETEDKVAVATDQSYAIDFLLQQPCKRVDYKSSNKSERDTLLDKMRRLDGSFAWKLLYTDVSILENNGVTCSSEKCSNKENSSYLSTFRRFKVYLNSTISLDRIGQPFDSAGDKGSLVSVKMLLPRSGDWGHLGYDGCATRLVSPQRTPAKDAASHVITSTTVENFIIDVSTRMGWCHPNLVECFGGFAERLVPNSQISQFHTYSSVREVVELNFQSEEDTLTAILCIGAVFEQLPTPLALQQERQSMTDSGERSHYLNSKYLSTYPQSWCSSRSLFTPLSEILLELRRGSRAPYTLLEAVSIVDQVADALQYVLLEKNSVPLAIRQAWSVISPSNVYIREVWETDKVSSTGTIPTSQFDVRFIPRFYVEEGPINRWSVPCQEMCGGVHVVSSESYGLAQLLIAITAGFVPFPDAITQRDICCSLASLYTTCTGDENQSSMHKNSPYLHTSGYLNDEIQKQINYYPSSLRHVILDSLKVALSDEPVYDDGNINEPTINTFRKVLREVFQDSSIINTLSFRGYSSNNNDNCLDRFEMSDFTQSSNRNLFDEYG